ncbi:hypothetical protein HPB50_014262 [Hyalomma asiaticum]|uniref:Uncharacterized protein n=1 Tax=Hyalomma asiaticum TaxID=266040 RepID=A0ACB7TGH0_HYAAI|nr:hypothetical protein HPB50_014262 [Hyalomma asiaticum]
MIFSTFPGYDPEFRYLMGLIPDKVDKVDMVSLFARYPTERCKIREVIQGSVLSRQYGAHSPQRAWIAPTHLTRTSRQHQSRCGGACLASAADFSRSYPLSVPGCFHPFAAECQIPCCTAKRKEADSALDRRPSDMPSHAGPFSDTETCFAIGPPEVAEGAPPRHASLS